MDPMEDPDDILRAHRSREKSYLFDVAFDFTATQVRGWAWAPSAHVCDLQRTCHRPQPAPHHLLPDPPSCGSMRASVRSPAQQGHGLPHGHTWVGVQTPPSMAPTRHPHGTPGRRPWELGVVLGAHLV